MSGKRSCLNYKLKKQTLSCTTKTKLHLPVSHEDSLLQGNNSARNLRFSTQVFLSVILKYVTTNILELVDNEAHNNCCVQRAVDKNPQLGQHFKNGNNSQVDEMF
ncbi:hypothetical protein PAL_GLEAN10007724 [Pteropus alecto]|uniref:Histone H2A n=1 Tax=Pteropus alecto TaxID=9402 RepID=L5JV79_PTEAL|nr:hypothetical protein PAL_GLEAN10007724 [Pteropus alecto]